MNTQTQTQTRIHTQTQTHTHTLEPFQKANGTASTRPKSLTSVDLSPSLAVTSGMSGNPPVPRRAGARLFG